MKKIIIFAFIVATLLFTLTPSVQAKQQFLKLPIPEWFSQAIQPIQDTIKALIGRVDNHEARIAELEKKIDLDLPNQWDISFYEDRFTMNTPPSDSSPGTISLPNAPVDNNCRWNNTVIDLNTSVRAIAHLSTGNIYGVGTCREITFKSNTFPASGTTFETDIYVFWQGIEKHAKQTITVPDRPFPLYGNLQL